MSQNLLLCEEKTNSYFDCNVTDESGISHSLPNQNHDQELFLDYDSCMSLMDFTMHSEDTILEMIQREKEHLPKDDYLERLRSGDLELSVRREALDWILKAQAHYGFGPLSVCLSANYLDRFLSVYQLPKGKAWTVQLLAVACLSIAAKMNEANVPLSVNMQVGAPKFVFEAKSIQRMELLVLSTLNWRMQALTCYSFIDYFLSKINSNQKHLSKSLVIKSLKVILSTIKGIDFLEFRPSEISAAVAISVSGEDQTTTDIDEAVPPCFSFIQIEKGRVNKCLELIKDLSLSSDNNMGRSSSPNGVLEAACLSQSFHTVGSSHSHKRRKQTNHYP